MQRFIQRREIDQSGIFEYLTSLMFCLWYWDYNGVYIVSILYLNRDDTMQWKDNTRSWSRKIS